MAQNAQDVVVAGTGAVYVAPDGTAIPDDLADPPSEWIDVGYTSEDGVTFTFSREQEDVNAWQVSTPVRVLVTNEPITIAAELLQFDRTTVMLAFRGGTFTGSAAPWVYTPPDAGASDVRALLVDAIDGAYQFRFGFPRVQLSEDVETQLVRSDAMRLPLTFNVLAAEEKWQIVSDHPGFGAIVAMQAAANLSREELNAQAAAAGVENPEALPNKEAVIAAMGA
jgi:hypothetical protein